MNLFFILGFILIIVIVLLIVTLKRKEIPFNQAAKLGAQTPPPALAQFPAIEGTEKGISGHTSFEAVTTEPSSSLVSKYIKAKQTLNEKPKEEKKEEHREVKANEVVFNLAQGTLLSEVLKRKT